MGSFHGAEICDLVGLYILNTISTTFTNNNIGLYRDDGLAIIEWAPPSDLERMDLYNDSFKPFHKANATIKYIDRGSNHPPHIKNGLRGMIEKRINTLSTNAKVFDESKPVYEAALKQSHHPNTLTFKPKPHPPRNKTTKKTRRRKCIFYNPPYCMSIKTNIGKAFLELIDKHFGEGHAYHSLFNRSNVKLSYCCMANVKSIIKAHNTDVLKKKCGAKENIKSCNCTRFECPLQGKCRTKNVIYEAEVTTKPSVKTFVGSTGREFKNKFDDFKRSFTQDQRDTNGLSKHIGSLKNNNIKFNIKWRILRQTRDRTNYEAEVTTKPSVRTYVGSTGGEFKKRFGEHRTSFNNRSYGDATTLSRHIWSIKDHDIGFDVKWRILRNMRDGSKRISRTCYTCNLERMEISLADQKKTLNKRSELISKCKHFNLLYF